MPVQFVNIKGKRFNPEHIICYRQYNKGVVIFTIDGDNSVVDDITVEEVDTLIQNLYYV